jgi:hypothetical protein
MGIPFSTYVNRNFNSKMIIVINIPVNLWSVAEEVIIEKFVGGEDLRKNNYQVSNLNTKG